MRYQLAIAKHLFCVQYQVANCYGRNGTMINLIGGQIYLDRGPQSIMQRFQIYDSSEHLLEDINNYNVLYAMTTLATSDAHVSLQRFVL